MKPHIRKTKGVWTCYMAERYMSGFSHRPRLSFLRVTNQYGHGYTPREAYADWQEQTRAARSAATT